jgi:hypothetical protein
MFPKFVSEVAAMYHELRKQGTRGGNQMIVGSNKDAKRGRSAPVVSIVEDRVIPAIA